MHPAGVRLGSAKVECGVKHNESDGGELFPLADRLETKQMLFGGRETAPLRISLVLFRHSAPA